MEKVKKLLKLCSKDVTRKIEKNFVLFLLSLIGLMIFSVAIYFGIPKQYSGVVLSFGISSYSFRVYIEQAVIFFVFSCFVVLRDNYSEQLSLGSTRSSYYISNIIIGAIFSILFAIFSQAFGHVLKFINASMSNSIVNFDIYPISQVLVDILYGWVLTMFIYIVVRTSKDIFSKNKIVGLLSVFLIVAVLILTIILIMAKLPQKYMVMWLGALSAFLAGVVFAVADYFVVTRGDVRR